MAHPSGVRKHASHRGFIGRMDRDRTAQVALALGALLGQQVALERLTALDRSAGANREALGGAPLGFHFRHCGTSFFLPRCRWAPGTCAATSMAFTTCPHAPPAWLPP